MFKKINIIGFFLIISPLLLTSCGNRRLAEPIGDNLSQPSALVSLSSAQKFLLLNGSSNGDYRDGSIQLYNVDNNGSQSFVKSFSIPNHASDIAISKDDKLVAVSFDSSKPDTIVKFYNYTTPTDPVELPFELKLPSTEGKQAVKNLGIFTRDSDSNYYVYGTIYTFAQSDGKKGAKIPSRVFLASIPSTLNSVTLRFILSYGLNDPNSLAPKSSSLNANLRGSQYSFGTSAPTYLGKNVDLFFAFPTGTMGGNNTNTNSYPVLPKALDYFGGTDPDPATTPESGKIRPDLRAVSLVVVDMAKLIGGASINYSAFFVPLAWNKNGVPYGSTTEGVTINSSADTNNENVKTFEFKTGFWASNWVNKDEPLNTSSSSENSLNADSVVVIKRDSGSGNDAFVINNIYDGTPGTKGLKTQIGKVVSVPTGGDSDFDKIKKHQVLDQFNTPITTQTTKTPLFYYMYSKTDPIDEIKNISTAVAKVGVVKTATNVYPYWTRIYEPSNSIGLHSTWLGMNSKTMSAGEVNTFPINGINPNSPTNYSFRSFSGAQSCTDFKNTGLEATIICVNFLTNEFSKFKVTDANKNFEPL